MRKPHLAVAGLLAGLVFANGCYGPFHLVRKVHKFNGEVSDNKWVVELAFLVMYLFPVYGLAGAADAIIFNSIEFWTGENPLAPASLDAPKTKRIVRGDQEILLSRLSTPAGEQLLLQQLSAGQPGQSLRVQREGNGMVAFNGEGQVVYRAQTLADGSVTISDAQGTQVAQYSEDQVQQFLKSSLQ